MDPLIVTATPNICWLEPTVPYPSSPSELAAEAKLCEDAGASILHMHSEGQWTEAIDLLRAQTSLIVQCGMSSLPIPERMEVFEARADMISIITSHHDEAFAGMDCHALHPREELLEYCRLSHKYGVRLELEIWHTGSIWNLKYMIANGALTPPYITTLFFDWPGGSWSPATVEEYEYRRRHLPDGSVATVSIMGSNQLGLLTAAILRGDHVRVGTEDQPRNRGGEVVATHELVAEISHLSRMLGREVATPDRAREIMGIGSVSVIS